MKISYKKQAFKSKKGKRLSMVIGRVSGSQVRVAFEPYPKNQKGFFVRFGIVDDSGINWISFGIGGFGFKAATLREAKKVATKNFPNVIGFVKNQIEKKAA